MTRASGTVEKALALLQHFTEQSPSQGLSKLARISGVNKATTLRYLLALQSAGFIEQDKRTSAYFLGPAFGRHARIRASANPFERAIDKVLGDLTSLVDETSHVSRLGSNDLETVSVAESSRSARVILSLTERLPLHATASGLSVLAWAAPGMLDEILNSDLEVFTEHTISTKEELLKVIKSARINGYSRGYQGFELDVVGLAAPFFDSDQLSAGAVAVAFPVSRSTPDLERTIAKAVMTAGRQLTGAIGGVEPEAYPTTSLDAETLGAAEWATTIS